MGSQPRCGAVGSASGAEERHDRFRTKGSAFKTKTLKNNSRMRRTSCRGRFHRARVRAGKARARGPRGRVVMNMGIVGRSVFAALCAASCSVAATAQGLSHWPDATLYDGFDGIASGPSSDADASRFLAQATFGPTSADIAHLRSIGYQAWFNE